MKICKVMHSLFTALAILLWGALCAHTAYTYCDLLWGGRYAGYSVAADTAFLLVIPYGIGIAVCMVAALFFRQKCEKGGKNK